MKKSARRGELLVETLVAMLIVSLMMLGLAVSITAAARINRETEQAVRSCSMSRAEGSPATATLRWPGGSAEIDVTQYRDNGYSFYE